MSENFVERQIVLGAGASDGYPLGGELLEEVVKLGKLIRNRFYKDDEGEYVTNRLNTNDTMLLIYFNKNKLFVETVRDLALDIEKSRPTSIDFYTSRIADTEKQKVVEALIGTIINSRILNASETWYGHLLPLFFPPNISQLDAKKKQEEIEKQVKKIQIVTFNYDLSLEKFLYEFLKNNVFFKSGEESFLESAREVIFNRIIHVYGSIDNPLTCNMDEIERKSISYHDYYLKILRDSFEKQEKYSENIRLIESKRSKDVKLAKCDYLYILGFGFDPLNIEQIGLKKDIWAKNCFVTNFNDNQKIKRIALNTLARNSGENDWLIPIISKSLIKEALEKDFSLMEEYDYSEKIPANQSLNGSSSPYFALMKYDTIKTNNEK